MSKGKSKSVPIGYHNSPQKPLPEPKPDSVVVTFRVQKQRREKWQKAADDVGMIFADWIVDNLDSVAAGIK